jgi:serine-type D-Ala-D-Ala carboxypeptidase (penicillin-binding protein 5/6)
MKRSFFLLVLAINFLFNYQLSAQSPTPQPPKINAVSYILLDFNTGTILAEQDMDVRVEPASLTKLMTAYVIFDALEDGFIQMDELVRISEKAWRTEGSRMFIEVDSDVPLESLLRGMIIQSGNDASVALAEHLAGTEEAFASLMNYQAGILGMENSFFENATGLPGSNHYVTARDIATLAAALIRDFPDFYSIYSERSYTYNGIQQGNRNTLLARGDGVDGLKTGYTDAAGYCLVTSAIRDSTRLITAVFGTNSTNARAEGSQALLNYGFRFFETRRLVSVGQELESARVWGGEPQSVSVGLPEDLYLTLPKGSFDQLSILLNVNESIRPPIAAGDEIGKIEILLNGSKIYENTLISLNSSDNSGYWRLFMDTVESWFE